METLLNQKVELTKESVILEDSLIEIIQFVGQREKENTQGLSDLLDIIRKTEGRK